MQIYQVAMYSLHARLSITELLQCLLIVGGDGQGKTKVLQLQISTASFSIPQIWTHQLQFVKE